MKKETTSTLEEARWGALSGFGLDKPSGDLRKDLFDNKRVLIQRGVNVRSVTAEPDMGDGVYQFIASTDGIKRDGNIVMNSGWHFDNFKRNPAFIWCHDYRALPIGQHLKWEVSGVGDASVLRIWSQFCSEELNPFAQRVRKMYDAGFLRAVSIGWSPIKWEWMQSEDDGDIEGIRFIESDLLEVSAVPVPSDPDAIIEAIHRNIISSEDMERMVEYGALPKISRGVAYVISNSDAPVKEEAIEEGTIEEEKRETNEQTEENEMLKEIMDALTKLGTEVREMRDDLTAVKARMADPVEPVSTDPVSIDPIEPTQDIPDEAAVDRAISVNADTTISDMTVPDDDTNDTMTPSVDKDGNPIPTVCGCEDDPTCLRACNDGMQNSMTHLSGLAARCLMEGRSMEAIDGIASVITYRELVVDVKSKLDEILRSIDEKAMVESEASKANVEFESRLADMGKELGVVKEEITVDDILAKARELGVIQPEGTVEDIEEEDDAQGDFLEKMLEGLKKV